MEISQVWVIRSMSSFLISLILLSTDTSHAQLEDYSSNLDSSIAALPPQDETNLDISFINDSPGLGVPGSDLFSTDNLDDSLFSTSPVSDILAGGDEPNLDLFASTIDNCSSDSSPRVNRRQACQSDADDLKSSTGNVQAQPGALTPRIIDNLIRNTPYGIELTIESDYAWCDPTLQRKYAICDSGFSYDRVPHFTSILLDVYDLYDCSPYFPNNPCKSPKKVWCCEHLWFSLDPFRTDLRDIATNCLHLFDAESFEMPIWMKDAKDGF